MLSIEEKYFYILEDMHEFKCFCQRYNTIKLSVFLSLLGSLQLYDIIQPLTGGGPSNVTHSMVTYLYYFGVMRMKIGFGSAVGVVIFLICVFIAIGYQRTLMRDDNENKF